MKRLAVCAVVAIVLTALATRVGFLTSKATATSTAKDYGAVWIAEASADAVVEEPPRALDGAAPMNTIFGADTGLDDPVAVTTDAAGDIFVANEQSDSINEYAADSRGDAEPIARIVGAKTDLDGPDAIAYQDGLIWVTDPTDNAVLAFTAGSAGDELPAMTISGALTDLDHPTALSASDDANLLWVLNTPPGGTPTVNGYSTKVGNVAPRFRVLTGMVAPTAIAGRSFVSVEVADPGNDSIERFTQGSGRSLGLASVIEGPNTELADPTSIGVNASDDTEVYDSSSATISTFASRASGDATPIATMTGVATGGDGSISVLGAAPTEPRDVKVVAGDHRATVSWRAPADSGGGITHYQVVEFAESSDGSVYATTTFPDEGPTATSKVVRGLRDGVPYEFFVFASNIYGQTQSPYAVTATPIGPPTAPRSVAVTPGHKRGTLVVAWAGPTNDDGRKIIRFGVRVSGVFYDASPRQRRLVIRGLTAGKRYKATVSAENAVGYGPASVSAGGRAG